MSVIRPAMIGALAVSTLSLLGCSSMLAGTGETEFACKAQSNTGVRCMSAREIYHATEHGAQVTNPATSTASVVKDGTSVAHPSVSAGDTSTNFVPPSPTIALERPMPIRSQAKVMRIWIAPWEDQHGDLHASGLVFTEIEPRRWNLGERMVAKAPVITPLQVTSPSQSSSASRQPAPNSSGSSPTPLSGVSVGLDSLQPNASGEKRTR